MPTLLPARKSGFTLIELALVAGIMGLVAMFFYPSLMRLVSTDKHVQAKRLVRTARDEIVGFVRIHNRFPQSLAEIGHGHDPWGKALEWELAPNLTNATNICRYCGTDMNATIHGKKVTNVALLVWSTGKNREDDVRTGSDCQVLNHEENYAPGKLFDDVVEVVSLAQLEGWLGGHTSQDCSDPDLLVCYPMNNSTDVTKIEDYAMYALHSTTVNNPQPCLDRFGCPGGAYDFDKDAQQYALVRDTGRYLDAGTDDISVAAWVSVWGPQVQNPNAPSRYYGAIVGKGFLANADGYGLLTSSKHNKHRYCFNFQIRKDYKNPKFVNSGSFSQYSVYDHQWRFVVGVADRDAPGNGLKIYVNGQCMGEADPTLAGPIIDPQAIPFSIGNAYGYEDHVIPHGVINRKFYFNGRIDDVQVYKRALTAIEVETIYNATRSLYR